MAAHTRLDDDDLVHSGIPRKGHLGASAGELGAIVGAIFVFAMIVLAFWFQAGNW